MRRRYSSSDEPNESFKRRKLIHNDNDDIGWETLTASGFGSEEELLKRKVTLNNQEYHYNDPNDHLIINVGDIIDNKYKVISTLGEGTFGKVLACKVMTNVTGDNGIVYEEVAIKIIKEQEKYKQAAFIELNTIKLLHTRDPNIKKYCINIIDWFAIGQHVCIVFPKMGPSLYSYMKIIEYRPTRMEFLRDFAWQILLCIEAIHHQKLIHTDLKPENILLVKDLEKFSDHRHFLQSTELSLIDFGSATFECSHHSSVVGTRYYRAPEVIFGQNWSFPVDIWAVACILLELYTGKEPFNTKHDLDHLYMMERMIGCIPLRFYQNCKKRYDVSSRGYLRVSEHIREKYQKVERLEDVIDGYDEDFYSLLKSMLKYDPMQRITAKDALKHRFFSRISAYSAPDLRNPSFNEEYKILSNGEVHCRNEK